MKYKVISATTLLLVLFLLATPVMAIGPWQAEEVGNNPNLQADEEPFEYLVLDTPNVDNNWYPDSESDNVWITIVREQYLSASNAKIKNAVPGSGDLFMGISTDPEIRAQYENKWIFISHDGFLVFLTAVGFSPEEVAQIASQYPDGVYYRYIHVGQ